MTEQVGQVREAFRKYDAASTGHIEKGVLSQLFKDLKPGLQATEFDKMMEHFGTVAGQPDRINYNAFIDFVFAGFGQEVEKPVDLPKTDPVLVGKIHSAVRWNKPQAEIEAATKAAGLTMAQAVLTTDPQNGNRLLHIASQNGHFDLVKQIVELGADINFQNQKGQTALHMSVAYDLYSITKFLLDKGADQKLKNGDGHEAILGIDGNKTGPEAWDAPLTKLKDAGDDKEELENAFKALEGAAAGSVDKASLVQTGLQKKKECPKNWDHARFMAFVKKL
jgi:Ca2+-binding EF-hand superfamily protein